MKEDWILMSALHSVCCNMLSWLKCMEKSQSQTGKSRKGSILWTYLHSSDSPEVQHTYNEPLTNDNIDSIDKTLRSHVLVFIIR